MQVRHGKTDLSSVFDTQPLSSNTDRLGRCQIVCIHRHCANCMFEFIVSFDVSSFAHIAPWAKLKQEEMKATTYWDCLTIQLNFKHCPGHSSYVHLVGRPHFPILNGGKGAWKLVSWLTFVSVRWFWLCVGKELSPAKIQQIHFSCDSPL